MSFTEREALKLRLNQLVESEKHYLQCLCDERENIYNRLKELDKFETKNNESYSTEGMNDQNNNINGHHNSNMKKFTSDNADKVAIEFLKSHTAAIRAKEIQEEILKQTGENVPNMTLFMNRLMKLDVNIKKPYRGQYIYEE